MIPDTDSDSDTSALRSARRLWRSDVILRRTWPTRRVSHTNGGTNTSENAARRQSRITIATIVAITVVAFWAMLVAVVVTTLSMPPMSLAIRDWTSPVRVRVKNANDIRCRCRYTAARRSCITRWPTTFEMYVCHTPIAAVAIAIPIIPSTSSVSSAPLCCGSAVSSTSRSRKGEIMLSPEANTIRAMTAASRDR
jgi:hypothetical protein